MDINLDETVNTATTLLMTVGLKVVGAIILYILGRMLIGFALKLLNRTLTNRAIDETVRSYAASGLGVLLNIALVVALLGYFGVETTTFAALLAAAGVAIGMAWSGLLSNFAAGIFLVVLRPFNAGDFVTVGGVTGTVVEIGLFVTIVNTPDNVKTVVGNNKVFSETIQNFSANDYRRVDLVAQLAHGADHADAIQRLQKALATVPNLVAEPAPDIEILEFNLAGPVLAVRPYCHTDNYWQVYFDTNRLIRDTFGEAGYPVPEKHYQVSGAQVLAGAE